MLATVTAAVAIGLTALPGAAMAAPALPADASCEFGTAPGPPVDESEAPQPGQAEPRPLPIPDPPVGGPAMGTCGDVVPEGAPAAPPVGVVSYVLADLDSGEVLAARNPHARLRPASLMKTLTGLLVARRLPLDETITGTQEDADQEGTRVGIGAGGQYTIRQVFDSMMMASGNDAAHALAVRLTGSVPATVDLMNTTARRLGALDTRAATPSGLDGPGMQTSAYDLASIFRVAMREEPFAQAVATRRDPVPRFRREPALRRRQRQQAADQRLRGLHRREDRLHRRRPAHLHRGGGAQRPAARRRAHARRAASGADVRAGERAARPRLRPPRSPRRRHPHRLEPRRARGPGDRPARRTPTPPPPSRGPPPPGARRCCSSPSSPPSAGSSPCAPGAAERRIGDMPEPLGEAFTRLAAAHPDRPAVTDDVSGWTFAQLEAHANRWAHELAGHGVAPGDFVSIALPNVAEHYALTIAAWKLGAVPQPVSHRLTPGELGAVLDVVRPPVVVGLAPGTDPDVAPAGTTVLPARARAHRARTPRPRPPRRRRPGRRRRRVAPRGARRSSSPARRGPPRRRSPAARRSTASSPTGRSCARRRCSTTRRTCSRCSGS